MVNTRENWCTCAWTLNHSPTERSGCRPKPPSFSFLQACLPRKLVDVLSAGFTTEKMTWLPGSWWRTILSNLRGDLPASVLSSYANAENLTDWFLAKGFFFFFFWCKKFYRKVDYIYSVVTNVENFVSKESSYSGYGW
jgi:hypothetical protein